MEWTREERERFANDPVSLLPGESLIGVRGPKARINRCRRSQSGSVGAVHLQMNPILQ